MKSYMNNDLKELLISILKETVPAIVTDTLQKLIKDGELSLPQKTYGKTDMLTEKEAAKVVGLAVKTLRNYRYSPTMRNEIPFHKIGSKKVLYQYSDLINYMNSRRLQLTSSIPSFR